MRFFKRHRNAKERVEDLKARVDSLRKIEENTRTFTLDDFLAGDDVISARGDSPDASAEPIAVPRIRLPEHAPRASYDASAPGNAVDSAPEQMSPLVAMAGDDLSSPVENDAATPPPIVAEEEAALAAELQRLLQRDAEQGAATEATEDPGEGYKFEWPAAEAPDEPETPADRYGEQADTRALEDVLARFEQSVIQPTSADRTDEPVDPSQDAEPSEGESTEQPRRWEPL